MRRADERESVAWNVAVNEWATPRLCASVPRAREAPSSVRRGGYLSVSVNLCHASALSVSVPPSRSAVSRTRTDSWPLAASTHWPPFASE